MKYNLAKSKYQYLSIIIGVAGLVLFILTKEGDYDWKSDLVIFIYTYLIVTGIIGLRKIRRNRRNLP